jgi:hypothetical protein
VKDTAARRKVVTRTYYDGSEPGTGSDRDTRYLTEAELAGYVNDLHQDAQSSGVHGTVHVDGQPYAAFGRSPS